MCDVHGVPCSADLQLRLGYRCFTGQELSASWLQQQRPHATSFSFEEFCCIVAEYKQKVSQFSSEELQENERMSYPPPLFSFFVYIR